MKCNHAWLGSYNKQTDQLLNGKEKPLLIYLVVDAMGYMYSLIICGILMQMNVSLGIK